MSRPSSGGFLFGFVAEIAVVVAAVSLLPRIDLSGGQAAADLPPRLPAEETSYYQRQPEPANGPSHVAAAPRFAPQPLDSFSPRSHRAAAEREPPPLIVVDPARPAYVEQRLDQASQSLVNGLGGYVARTADNLLSQPSAPAPAAGQPSGGSFSAPPASRPLPRPWIRY